MHIHPSSPNSDTSLQSEESAAIKIQAGFRGYRVRKQLNQSHSQAKRKSLNGYQRPILRSRAKRQHFRIMSSETEHSTDANAGRFNCSGSGSGGGVGVGGVSGRGNGQGNGVGLGVGVGVTRFNNNNNDRRIGVDEATVEERSATKIQAGIRGYLVRKKQKLAADAATKIQAGFRGFKARKEAQKLRQM